MNTFGRKLRVSIFGESHGNGIGTVIDGVPAGIALSEADLVPEIERRKSGAKGTTPRNEDDAPRILSGVFEGHTTGAPLTILFQNGNTRSKDYSKFAQVPRPGHADFVAAVKYDGYNDYRGGGHFSGRITLPVVAAGAVAKSVLWSHYGRGPYNYAEAIEKGKLHYGPVIQARVIEIGGEADQSRWDELITSTIKAGESLGGIVECVASGLPIGLGEPFWDSVESLISHAIFSIPGVRGIEFGDGFKASRMHGSEHNDCILDLSGRTATNGAGGVNGGISNGNDLVFRVAFKPTSTINKSQITYSVADDKMVSLRGKGRHDVCFTLRTPVIVEAMTAIVLADLALLFA